MKCTMDIIVIIANNERYVLGYEQLYANLAR